MKDLLKKLITSQKNQNLLNENIQNNNIMLSIFNIRVFLKFKWTLYHNSNQ